MTPYFLVCAALSIIEAFVCSAVIFISRRKGAEAEVWLRLQVGAAVGWVLGGSLQAGLFLPSPPPRSHLLTEHTLSQQSICWEGNKNVSN